MTAPVIVVMGVSGAGKTTIGKMLAARLGYPFQDADELHPAANVAKMTAGHPLDDADRAPWLAALRDWVRARLDAGETGVLAASLLKRAYRDEVIGGDGRVALVYLRGDPATIARRMEARPGHFMKVDMLRSQLATLEEPGADEGAVVVDVAGTPDETAEAAFEAVTGGGGPR